MFVSENQMDENQGILLFNAFDGLAYQIAGALSRLGKRILTVQKEASPRQKLLPIQNLEKNWAEESEKYTQVIWTAEHSLIDNSPLSLAEKNELEDIIAKLKTVQSTLVGTAPQLTIIIPSHAYETSLETKLRELERFNVLLSPAAWGFGDESLLDSSLNLWADRPGVLLKKLSEEHANTPRRWISFEELASQTVVCTGNMPGSQNVIEMEGQRFSIQEWQDQFNADFETEAGFMEKLASRMSSETLLDALPEGLLGGPTESTLSANTLPVKKSTEVFPNPPTSLSRSLSTVLRAYSKNPEMRQCFLPGKSV